MGHAIETIAEGHPLQSSLEALYARRGLRPTAVCTVRGALTAATLRSAPDAPPTPLGGPLYLVHGTVVPAGRRVQIMAMVSWSDNGLPRLAGGLLDDAISAGIQVIVPLAEPAEDAPANAPPPVTTSTESPTRSRRRRSKKKTAVEESPHVDLSAELAALGGSAPAEDAEAPPWEPTPPAAPAKPKQKPPAQGAGWGAAVAASRAAPAASRRPASPSDLGFDVDGPPDLRKGDTIIHPRFGRCRVVKPSRDRVKVRRPTGAFIDLHLKVCHFTRLPDEDGRRVFDLRIGR